MKTMEKSEFEKLNAFGTGRDNTAYARYFIGRSYLNPLTKPQDGLALSNVTFEPGCRNNWHIHHATAGGGQILICTGGGGLVSGGGQSARQPETRYGRRHPGQCKALARRQGGQLVFPYRV